MTIDLYDQNAPNMTIGLICTKPGAFTITGVILPKDCTYPPDYRIKSQPFVPYEIRVVSIALKSTLIAEKEFNRVLSLVLDKITSCIRIKMTFSDIS